MAFDYEIVKHIATISDSGTTRKELNLISYNGAAPKFDLRTWQQQSEGWKMLKGVTLNAEEMDALFDAMKSIRQ